MGSIGAGIPFLIDWQGNGYRSPAYWSPINGTWYMTSCNPAGGGFCAITNIISYGASGDAPVIGRWPALTYDTLGVDRAGAWWEWQYDSTPVPFGYGNSTDTPVPGYFGTN